MTIANGHRAPVDVAQLRAALVELYGPGTRDAELGLDAYPGCPSCGTPADGSRPLALHDDGRLSCSQDHCASDDIRAALTEHTRPSTPAATTWAPVDLASLLAAIGRGDDIGPRPTVAGRSDGTGLIYPGRVHWLQGEPEAGKGWLSLLLARQVLNRGDQVLMLDFEDDPAGVIPRLTALGVPTPTILDRFHYVRPTERFAGLEPTLARGPYALAIVDGVTEAGALLGLDTEKNHDTATFLQSLPRPIAATGAAVVVIDHVTKSKDTRGRYALGGGHKLAGVTATYGVEAVDPFSRARGGKSNVVVHKDRPGHVRGHDENGVIAVLTVRTDDDGQVTAALDPPAATTSTSGDFRPTKLMERASIFIEGSPGVTTAEIKDAKLGKTEWVLKAVRALEDEGYIRVEPGPRSSRLHHPVRDFREATDPGPVPAFPPVPDPFPERVPTTRSPVPPPTGGTERERNAHTTQNTRPVPGATEPAPSLLPESGSPEWGGLSDAV